jgi:hypothetical protein
MKKKPDCSGKLVQQAPSPRHREAEHGATPEADRRTLEPNRRKNLRWSLATPAHLCDGLKQFDGANLNHVSFDLASHVHAKVVLFVRGLELRKDFFIPLFVEPQVFAVLCEDAVSAGAALDGASPRVSVSILGVFGMAVDVDHRNVAESLGGG